VDRNELKSLCTKARATAHMGALYRNLDTNGYFVCQNVALDTNNNANVIFAPLGHEGVISLVVSMDVWLKTYKKVEAPN